MKRLILSVAVLGTLASCTQDATCTCTTDAYDLGGGLVVEASTTVSECLDCTSEEIDAFEQSCADADAVLQAAGAGIPGYNASCTLD